MKLSKTVVGGIFTLFALFMLVASAVFLYWLFGQVNVPQYVYKLSLVFSVLFISVSSIVIAGVIEYGSMSGPEESRKMKVYGKHDE